MSYQMLRKCCFKQSFSLKNVDDSEEKLFLKVTIFNFLFCLTNSQKTELYNVIKQRNSADSNIQKNKSSKNFKELLINCYQSIVSALALMSPSFKVRHIMVQIWLEVT